MVAKGAPHRNGLRPQDGCRFVRIRGAAGAVTLERMGSTETSRGSVRAKEFHFPLSVEWVGGRRVEARVDGKPALEIAPPPVFRGTDPELWSPEDLFVASAAACLAVTFTGLAARAELPYRRLHVGSDGVCGRRDDGRFGFTRILLRVELETEPEHATRARELAEEAEAQCLVSVSLDLPVEAEIRVNGA
jgi:organic hydroperoxide reductase OsmC/OhrA